MVKYLAVIFALLLCGLARADSLIEIVHDESLSSLIKDGAKIETAKQEEYIDLSFDLNNLNGCEVEKVYVQSVNENGFALANIPLQMTGERYVFSSVGDFLKNAYIVIQCDSEGSFFVKSLSLSYFVLGDQD